MHYNGEGIVHKAPLSGSSKCSDPGSSAEDEEDDGLLKQYLLDRRAKVSHLEKAGDG